jgi:aminopeptidase N
MWLKIILLIFLTFALNFTNAKPPQKVRFDFDANNGLKTLAKVHFTDLNYRLPNNTIPRHYDIHLETDIHLANFGFSGEVTITIEALQNTNVIVLHIRQLSIFKVDLFDNDSNPLQTNIQFTVQNSTEMLIIHNITQLNINQRYKLKISYVGYLRTDDAGFYRSSYIDNNGEQKWLATTQFQATDARHAFPW